MFYTSHFDLSTVLNMLGHVLTSPNIFRNKDFLLHLHFLFTEILLEEKIKIKKHFPKWRSLKSTVCHGENVAVSLQNLE